MTHIPVTTEYWNIYETVQRKKREELSLLSVVFCLLVVFIHVSAEPVTLYQKDSPVYLLTLSLWRLSSFVVQGFLFLSGVKLFLNFKIDDFAYPRFLLCRLRRVVLPYVVAFCLFYLWFLPFNAVDASPAAFLRHLLLGSLTSHFYFVVVILQFYLLMPLWRVMAKRGSPLICLTASLILMMILKQYLPELLSVLFGVESFPHNHRLFTSYLFYFVLGVFAGVNYDSFLGALRKQTKAVAVGWTAAALINCVFIYWNSTGRYYAGWLDNFHILYCFLSILFCLALGDRVTRAGVYPRLRPLVKTVDGASYQVYLIHPLFIFMVDRVLYKAGAVSVSLRYAVRFGVVYGLCLGFCLLAGWWRRKQKGFTKQQRRRLVMALIAAAVVCLLAAVLVGASIWRYGEGDGKRSADAAIVLGAAATDEGVSPVYRERLNHAVWLYENGYVSYIITTGGTPEGSVRAESEVGKGYLMDCGVPEAVILTESLSRITEQNLRNAKALMEERGITSCILVSDPLHMKRAMVMAADCGMEAYASPTPTTMYRSLRTKLPFLVREAFFYVGYCVLRPFR